MHHKTPYAAIALCCVAILAACQTARVKPTNPADETQVCTAALSDRWTETGGSVSEAEEYCEAAVENHVDWSSDVENMF